MRDRLLHGLRPANTRGQRDEECSETEIIAGRSHCRRIIYPRAGGSKGGAGRSKDRPLRKWVLPFTRRMASTMVRDGLKTAPSKIGPAIHRKDGVNDGAGRSKDRPLRKWVLPFTGRM